MAIFDANKELLATSQNEDFWLSDSLQTHLGTYPPNGNDVQFLPLFVNPDTDYAVMLIAQTTPEGLTAVGAFYPTHLIQQAQRISD